jgi:hypothetical protein
MKRRLSSANLLATNPFRYLFKVRAAASFLFWRSVRLRPGTPSGGDRGGDA